jgi:hypothetical protein
MVTGNVSQIAHDVAHGLITMRDAVRILDALGYTVQERRRIITGAIRYRKLWLK